MKAFSYLSAWVLVHSFCKEIMELGCEMELPAGLQEVTTDSGGLGLLRVRKQPPVQGRTSGRHRATAFSQHCPGADEPSHEVCSSSSWSPAAWEALDCLPRVLHMSSLPWNPPCCLLSCPRRLCWVLMVPYLGTMTVYLIQASHKHFIYFNGKITDVISLKIMRIEIIWSLSKCIMTKELNTY